jgi:hypothetical protein
VPNDNDPTPLWVTLVLAAVLVACLLVLAVIFTLRAVGQ